MDVTVIDPPRQFEVGRKPVAIRHTATVALEPDEQVTFTTPEGGEFDVVRKDFGFYATPSLNHRLPSFGLRTALVRNVHDRYYVLLVHEARMGEFERYCEVEAQVVVAWLDDDRTLAAIAAAGH